MSDQNPLDVEAIRARLDAATPGPWKDDGDVSGIVADSGERVTEGDNSGYGCVYISDADRALIAHAPTDLRDLLDENARLNAENERYLRIIDEITRDNAGLIACLDAAQAEARKMLNEHGQSWNSISGRRIMQAIDNATKKD